MHQALGRRRGPDELSPRSSLYILPSLVARYTPHEAKFLPRRTCPVFTMYSRMFSLYADDLTTTPRIMRYQHQSLAMALLVLITYVRSGLNIGPRLAVLKHHPSVEAQHYPGPCEGIVRLWNLPSCRVESHLFLSIEVLLDPSVIRSSGRFTTQVLLQDVALNSRRNVSPAKRASRYGNSGRLRPPWCSRLRRGVDTELYLGAPARVFSQVRQGRWGSFLD